VPGNVLSMLIIPVGNMRLAASDRAQPIHCLLHAAGFVRFAGLAEWAGRSTSPR
jgi:hypothetical protein